MNTIVLNQSNLINNGKNSTLVYNFPSTVDLTNKYVCVVSISMFYSWFNITQQSSNNIITFQWDSTLPAVNIVIPDGLYEIVQLNQYLQWWFIENGFYYIDSSGNYVYMAEMLINSTRYAVQLNTYLNYTAATLPVGYTLPGNFVGYPPLRQNPVVGFPANFNVIVGYQVGFLSDANISNAFVPPSPTQQNNYVSKQSNGTISYLSSQAPQVQPNSNILFSLVNVNSPYSQPSGIIYSLNPNSAVGEKVYEVPPNFVWTKFIDGYHPSLTLTMLGTDKLPLTIQDPNMTILLAIKDKGVI